MKAGIKIKNRVFITVDVEGDWSLFPNEQKHFNSDLIIQNLDVLDSLINSSKLKFDVDIPITWFIRCDESVKVNLGCYEGLLQKLEKFIEKKYKSGDAFGLHPHLYSFSDNSGNENKITDDEIEDQIGESISAWKKFFGVNPKFTRIGEARMSNTIASALDKNHIEIDSTALPGRWRNDNGFNFNWSLTGSELYNPSKSNYQIESKNPDENYRFIEAPFTMIPTKSNLDEKIISRYLNLSFKNQIIKNSLSSIIDERDVICVVHPHEVISKKNNSHHIISYSETAFIKNIKSLIDNLNSEDFYSFEALKL